MEIFVINLARRPDRAALISSALNELGLKFVFVEAVDWQAEGTYPKQEWLSTGYACNVLSHHKALELFLKSDAEFAMIMEDDAVLSPDVDWPTFIEELPRALADRGMDYLQLGFISQFYSSLEVPRFLESVLARFGRKPKRRARITVGNRAYQAIAGESFAGSHLYVCSRRFAEMTPPLQRPQWVAYDGFLQRLAAVTTVLSMWRLRVSLAEQDSRQLKGKKADSDISGSPRG